MRVALFTTCLVDLMRPGIGFAAMQLLESAGCDVSVPRTQTCCGQPGYNGGDRAGAHTLACKVLDEFGDFDYIVAPSGSCAGMIRTHYPEVLRDDADALERHRELAARTYELTDFLVNVARVRSVPGVFDGTVTYHDACSGLRELGVKAQPRALLALVRGLKLIEMKESETCCGFGGLFSVKYGDIASHIAERKCSHALATRADAIVLGDLGCMLHIEGRLRRRGDTRTRVLHVAEVLAGGALPDRASSATAGGASG